MTTPTFRRASAAPCAQPSSARRSRATTRSWPSPRDVSRAQARPPALGRFLGMHAALPGPCSPRREHPERAVRSPTVLAHCGRPLSRVWAAGATAGGPSSRGRPPRCTPPSSCPSPPPPGRGDQVRAAPPRPNRPQPCREHAPPRAASAPYSPHCFCWLIPCPHPSPPQAWPSSRTRSRPRSRRSEPTGSSSLCMLVAVFASMWSARVTFSLVRALHEIENTPHHLTTAQLDHHRA